MPSPFPGMDPYTEDKRLWEVFHSRFIAGMMDALNSRLAPKYVAEVPQDLFANQSLRYERTATGYRFYSVGPNEKDDGGRNEDDLPRGDDLLVTMPVPLPVKAD